MKRRQVVYMFASIILTVMLLSLSTKVQAAENNGGAVQTKGEVGFYRKTDPSSTTEPTQSSSEPVEKPTGRYPSTGELVIKSLSLSGAVLVVIAGYFLIFKRKKQDDGEGS